MAKVGSVSQNRPNFEAKKEAEASIFPLLRAGPYFTCTAIGTSPKASSGRREPTAHRPDLTRRRSLVPGRKQCQKIVGIAFLRILRHY